MAEFTYGLCALAAFACAWLLLLAYSRSRYRMLLWGGLCFLGQTVANIVLVVDKLVLPEIDLTTWRLLPMLISMAILLYGLVWDAE